MTYSKIGEIIGISSPRVSFLCKRGIQKLRNQSVHLYIENGLEGGRNIRREAAEEIGSCDHPGQIEKLKDVLVTDCGLSTRSRQSLSRGGYPTLGDVVEAMDKDPYNIRRLRNLGKQSLLEVVEKLEEYGVDCRDARKAYRFDECLAALTPSIRLYNVLTHAGLDTIQKIEEEIETDPERIINLHGMGEKTRGELIEMLEKAGVDAGPLKEEATLLFF